MNYIIPNTRGLSPFTPATRSGSTRKFAPASVGWIRLSSRNPRCATFAGHCFVTTAALKQTPPSTPAYGVPLHRGEFFRYSFCGFCVTFAPFAFAPVFLCALCESSAPSANPLRPLRSLPHSHTPAPPHSPRYRSQQVALQCGLVLGRLQGVAFD